MTAKALMFMGTGSDVGKSLIVAGLCRLFASRGIKVVPFKPQNMSNNAAVTADGGEIGRAQALQARAARIPSTVHMNPVLLKPESGTGAQVIVQGKRAATMSAKEFFAGRQQFMPAILDSFMKLKSQYDLILVEGAGSPAEINLREGDLANMGFARAASLPAVLVGDIHRGGVIASIAGTFDLLDPPDRALLKAFLINKFHGDPSLFAEGKEFLEKRTSTPCLGIVPYFADAWKLPAEDAVALEQAVTTHSNKSKIVVLKIPRIANFDDLDPIKLEPGVSLEFLEPAKPIPADAKLVIIPGSKSTITDLEALRNYGWDIDLMAHHRRGGHILGLCGGYQMLGRKIHDPDGIEGRKGSVHGLGLLNVETTLRPQKRTVLVSARHLASGQPISGYEIHVGVTEGPDCKRPFAETASGPDGAVSADGLVQGTYLHGSFVEDGFRSAYLKSLNIEVGNVNADTAVESTLDALAHHLERHVDILKLLSLAA